MNQIINDATNAINQLIEGANLKEGNLVVIGCSTSEICGDKIGSNSNVDVAEEVFSAIYSVIKEKKLYLAAQCCEHLNRALIIEKEYAESKNIPFVNVIPQPKAGGSFATKAYENFSCPVAVEEISADCGMDIGNTLIGMHIKKVAVPLRIETKTIGFANVVCARTRPKFIGGERAIYNKDLM